MACIYKEAHTKLSKDKVPHNNRPATAGDLVQNQAAVKQRCLLCAQQFSYQKSFLSCTKQGVVQQMCLMDKMLNFTIIRGWKWERETLKRTEGRKWNEQGGSKVSWQTGRRLAACFLVTQQHMWPHGSSKVIKPLSVRQHTDLLYDFTASDLWMCWSL